MKKLNRKGFTLIELLAVIVILAVVMGIAVNSVLSSMNKARGGSVTDTALIIANGFNQAYTESLVNGQANAVYSLYDSQANGVNFPGYDFVNTGIYYLDKRLASTFNISEGTYVLHEYGDNVTSLGKTTSGVTESFVSYNSVTGKFVVCMAVQKTGPNYVNAYALSAATPLSGVANPSTNPDYNTLGLAAQVMMGCSDGTQTWK